MGLQGAMVDVPNTPFVTWISVAGIGIFDVCQSIQGDLEEGLQISGEFISYLDSGQATECIDYTRLSHGRMKRWFLLGKPSIAASGECRHPFRIRSPSLGREGTSGEAEAPRLALTEQNVESEGMSGVAWLHMLLVFFQERGQGEGLGNGVLSALNLYPETMISGKYSRICYWANLPEQTSFWCSLFVI